MRKSRLSGEIVRLNGATFRLNPDEVRAGNLEALVDEALSRVFGGGEEACCTEFRCVLFAPPPPPEV
jgi:hypothetical protein